MTLSNAFSSKKILFSFKLKSATIGSDNCLAPNYYVSAISSCHDADFLDFAVTLNIIWNNDGLVYWCIHAHRWVNSSMPSDAYIRSLTHWGRVTHICVSKLNMIGLDNGLLPGRRQVIIGTNAGILLIGPSRTHFSVFLIEIHTFSLKKMHLKMSSGMSLPQCVHSVIMDSDNDAETLH